MPDFFSDLTTLALASSLDGTAMRHKVIADNIANVMTPGFSRSDVSFEGKLKEAFEAGNVRKIESNINQVEPEVEADTTSAVGPDGNNVSIDKEMADLTKNTLQYEALVQLINLKGAMVRSAVNGGSR